jgi:hypothetical protein
MAERYHDICQLTCAGRLGEQRRLEGQLAGMSERIKVLGTSDHLPFP